MIPPEVPVFSIMSILFNYKPKLKEAFFYWYAFTITIDLDDFYIFPSFHNIIYSYQELNFINLISRNS